MSVSFWFSADRIFWDKGAPADKEHDAFNKTRKMVSDSNKEVLRMLESGDGK